MLASGVDPHGQVALCAGVRLGAVSESIQPAQGVFDFIALETQGAQFA
jgi:hypothetical protein